LAALKGNAAATASVPASFAVAASRIAEPLWAGPLTVERAEDSLAALPSDGDFVSGVDGLERGFEGGMGSLPKIYTDQRLSTASKRSLYLRSECHRGVDIESKHPARDDKPAELRGHVNAASEVFVPPIGFAIGFGRVGL
jgi:hypothetical protein